MPLKISMTDLQGFAFNNATVSTKSALQVRTFVKVPKHLHSNNESLEIL